MNKTYIKFDDEAVLEQGLPSGVKHEVDAEMLFSVPEGAELPEGARLAELEEYEAAELAATERLKAIRTKRAKRSGMAYEGTTVPFTSDAAMAFLQVEGAFAKMEAAGLPAEKIRTNMVFEQVGTVLPVSIEGGEIDVAADGEEPKMVLHHKFADVALWFTVKRNGLYQ